MIIDPNNERHIIADEGKAFRRIISNELFGPEMYLGYSYYIGGVLQDPPHLDVIEDFEEVPIPEPEESEEPELPENQEVNEESSELPEEEQPS